MHRVSHRAFPQGERHLLHRRARGHVDAGLRLRGHVRGIWDVDRESSHDLRSSAALDLARSRESDGRSRQSCLDICDREVCAEVAHWAPFPASWVVWLLGVSRGIADQEAHCVWWDRPDWLLQPGPNSSPFITTTHGPVLCHTPGSSDVSFLMRLARSRHRLRRESCTPASHHAVCNMQVLPSACSVGLRRRPAPSACSVGLRRRPAPSVLPWLSSIASPPD